MYATTKIVKIADSAAISEIIPTRPCEGRIHFVSTFGSVKMALLKRILLCYSYFQSGSSGCFMSQSGLRLSTIGVLAKLHSGGGDAVDHSNVHASQGSGPAGSPSTIDHSKLRTNASTPAI